MLEAYIRLIEQFASGEITADEFEDTYIDLWYQYVKTELSVSSPETILISDLFLEVDAYSNQPPHNVSADELREAALKALAELLSLQKERN